MLPLSMRILSLVENVATRFKNVEAIVKNVATMVEIIATTVDNVAKYSSTTFFWQNCGFLYVHTVYNAQEMPYRRLCCILQQV
jgi:hypothetical protein